MKEKLTLLKGREINRAVITKNRTQTITSEPLIERKDDSIIAPIILTSYLITRYKESRIGIGNMLMLQYVFEAAITQSLDRKGQSLSRKNKLRGNEHKEKNTE